MMKQGVLITISFLLLLGSGLSAQSYAVYMDAPNKDLPVNRLTYNEIFKALKDRVGLKGTAYQMNDGQLSVDTIFHSADDEIAADYLLSIFYAIYEEYDLKLKFVQDTNKNVISAYFPIGTVTRYKIILTDLHTNEMTAYAAKLSQNIYEQQKGKQLALTNEEFVKYFGVGGPVALQNKSITEYNKVVEIITKTFRPKFEEYYKANRLDIDAIVTDQLRKSDAKIIQPIKNPIVDKGKLKSFDIPPSKGLAYHEGMYVTVFTLDTLGDYIIPDNYKWWVVDQVGPNGSHAETKFLISSKNKEAGDALEAGKQLYFMAGSTPYAAYKGDEKEITIDVQGADLHGAVDVYSFLTRSPRMRIINSLEADLIHKLHERFKGGRFVDSGYALNSLGASLIVASSDVDFVIQEAQAGTVLGSCPKKYGDKGLYDLFQKTLDLKVRIIKPIDEKKGVLKSALVYSPMGFYDDFYFDIMLVTAETVNGRTLYRESEIGRGNMYNEEKYGYIFGEAKFNKGEKEIGAAYFGKQDLMFLSHEFKFPFVGKFK